MLFPGNRASNDGQPEGDRRRIEDEQRAHDRAVERARRELDEQWASLEAMGIAVRVREVLEPARDDGQRERNPT